MSIIDKLLARLSNKHKTHVVMAYDILMSALTFVLAYSLRLETVDFGEILERGVSNQILIITPIQFLCFYSMGSYRGIWRFSSTVDLTRLIKGVSLAIPFSMLGLFIFKQIDIVPRSILFIQWFLLVVAVGGGRFAYRMYKDNLHTFMKSRENKRTQNTIVVGAGYTAQNLVKDIKNDLTSNINLVGIVDDDISIHKKILHGIKIIGQVKDISSLAEELDVKLVIIAVPSASRKLITNIVKACESTKITVQTVPKMSDLLSGKVQISKLKKVMPTDLLGREQVDLDLKAMSESITNKVVLVTGGGGSIGSELCYQILKLSPKKLICFDLSELNMYELGFKLEKVKGNTEIEFVIGDVRDLEKIESIFAKFSPQTVYHAAAYKHVPMMELNPDEAIKVNILGTRVVANLCDSYKVEKFVLVSTDKAVNPTNVMGTTKRIAEMVCQEIQKKSATKYVIVRFGNVLGSSGSVIPRFQAQIEAGGPVTVTHPEIERYFMCIPEAAKLVIQAGAYGKGGEIFVLDMGEPVKIYDLAHQMITLAGLKLGEDIDIEFTGLRPGEKLYEELLANEETTLPTHDPRVRIAKVRGVSESFNDCVANLINYKTSVDVRYYLKEIVPEYNVPSNLS